MDFLSNGPYTCDELIEAMRVQSRDESNNPVFSNDGIKLALHQAIVNSHHSFFTTATTTLSFVSGTLEYTIANDVQRITNITRDRSSSLTGSNTLVGVTDQDIRAFRHFNYGFGSNKLVFLRDYPTCTMTLVYERDVQVPLENRVTGAALTDTSTSLTLVSANPQLWHLALPAYAKIDNEIIKITAISGNTSCTIVRGQMGSTAASHTNGSAVGFIVRSDTIGFYNYLFAEMGRLLNNWRVQSGSGQVDVSANITAGRLFKDDREEIIHRRRQNSKPRKMRFLPSRRPRRGY